MSEEPKRSFRLFSMADDQPQVRQGMLIPPTQNQTNDNDNVRDFHPLGVQRRTSYTSIIGWSFATVAVFLLLIVGLAGYGTVVQSGQVATPAITLIDPQTNERSVLGVGPHHILEQEKFFRETREALIDEGVSFIDVDTVTGQLLFFKRGVLLLSAAIEAIAEPASWRHVPAGLYEVESLERRPFSSISQVYLPEAIRFGGNYIIHGIPEYPDGSVAPVAAGVDGVRLTSADAKHLFSLAAESMPVLVHAAPLQTETFIYEPAVTAVTASHYLVADIETGTILATNDILQAAPIASIVKLMTAVVAADEINLDRRVSADAPTFVESLVPRLQDRATISMYGLLQLLLLESSNEAAEVIAAQVGRDEFISLMNQKAVALGMEHTTFVDPSGLAAGNEASVQDLYTLVRYIYEDRPFILDITRDESDVAPVSGDGLTDLVNFNQVDTVANFIGGKVGETAAAGKTSVSLHEVMIQDSPRTLVVIILGSEERSADIETLLQHVINAYDT